MTHPLAPGSHRPVSGLGQVRALAGLGCAGACACQQQNGTSGVMDVVKSPVFVLVAGVVVVGAFILIREAARW